MNINLTHFEVLQVYECLLLQMSCDSTPRSSLALLSKFRTPICESLERDSEALLLSSQRLWIEQEEKRISALNEMSIVTAPRKKGTEKKSK